MALIIVSAIGVFTLSPEHPYSLEPRTPFRIVFFGAFFKVAAQDELPPATAFWSLREGLEYLR